MESRVLLISMPFSSLHHPNLGLSLLKAGLNRRAIGCDVRYFFLEYAEKIGVSAYAFIQDDRHFGALLGDWMFSHLCSDHPNGRRLDYCTEVLVKQHGFSAAQLLTVLQVQSSAAGFIESCLEAVDWSDYRIVGFTTSFQQTTASLALARRLKARHPHLTIVFGGANCEGEMGLELMQRFPFIDFVCSGEGDLAFPRLVESLMEDGGEAPVDLPGIISRVDDQVLEPSALTSPVRNLDDLPYPDFSDFFEQHKRSGAVSRSYRPVLLFESARGCWWGQKHHCTFCGLNGSTMTYRSKSQTRAFAELRHLAETYTREVLAVDNILDMKYFSSFIPQLETIDPPVVLHYETKTNLKPWQVAALSRAGVRKIQPGIESLDSGILKLMRKGCNRLQNIQILKLAAEHSIRVEWGFLYGFPGEAPEAYAEMAGLVPLLRHLPPPADMVKVRADRFSPFFEAATEYNITVEPNSNYYYIYNFDDASIKRLAYHFNIRPKGDPPDYAYVKTAAAAVKDWITGGKSSSLDRVLDGESVVVRDGRGGKGVRTVVIRGLEARIHEWCGEIEHITRLENKAFDLGFSSEDVQQCLSSLTARGLLVGERGDYLALAVRRPPPEYASPLEALPRSRTTERFAPIQAFTELRPA